MAAPALSHYDKSGHFPLQRNAQCLSKYPVKVAVHIEKQSIDKDARMYPSRKLETSLEPRRVTKQSALKLVQKALENQVGGKSCPVKHIQKAADVDRSTADSWLKGRNLPSAHHLLNLMIEWPDFAASIRRIVTMEAELHEDLTREISALVRRAMQR